MNKQETAKYYLQFWYQAPDNTWHLGDNAPSRFWVFLSTLPKHTNRQMLHQALVALSTGQPTPDPEMPAMLDWLSAYPTAIPRVDAVLKQGRDKNLKRVLEKAYNAEVYALADLVHEFISKEN